MAGLRGKVLLAVILLFGMSSSAQAWYWGWGGRGYYSSAYYGPAYYAPSSYWPAYYFAPVYPLCNAFPPAFVPEAARLQSVKPETVRPETVRPPETPAPNQPSSPPKKVTETKPPPAPTTTEPVLGNMMKKGPTVTESRSLGGAYAQGANVKDRCKVGFWNLTGRDVTLKVGGQTRSLPKDRAVTLDLERAFAWQLDQGDMNSERVPEDQPFHEVILRQ